jgi:ABC-type branched-subunit amino acid transport system ATPase component
MLHLENTSFGYGPITICQNINLEIKSGEIVCLLGRNGMGKTTTLEGIMGLTDQHTGSVHLKDENISSKPAHKRARLGIGLVPQGRRIFANISIRDNLRLGTLAGNDRCQPIPEMILEFFPILSERLNQKANTLSGGEQQMLAIGRALAGEPRLILLDEPSEGLAPIVIEAIGELITHLRNRGITIFIAEQNLSFALDVSDRGYVMEKGRIVLDGDTELLQSHKTVREYLVV